MEPQGIAKMLIFWKSVRKVLETVEDLPAATEMNKKSRGHMEIQKSPMWPLILLDGRNRFNPQFSRLEDGSH